MPGAYDKSYSWAYNTGCAWYPHCKPCESKAVEFWISVYREAGGGAHGVIQKWRIDKDTSQLVWERDTFDISGRNLIEVSGVTVDSSGNSYFVVNDFMEANTRVQAFKYDTDGNLLANVDLTNVGTNINTVFKTNVMVDGGITLNYGRSFIDGDWRAMSSYSPSFGFQWFVDDKDGTASVFPASVDSDKAGNTYMGMWGSTSSLSESIKAISPSGNEMWSIGIPVTGGGVAPVERIAVSNDNAHLLVLINDQGGLPEDKASVRSYSSSNGAFEWATFLGINDISQNGVSDDFAGGFFVGPLLADAQTTNATWLNQSDGAISSRHAASGATTRNPASYNRPDSMTISGGPGAFTLLDKSGVLNTLSIPAGDTAMEGPACLPGKAGPFG